MKQVNFTILIGQFAQRYYLVEALKPTLTDTVKNFKEYLPLYLPLVHPSLGNKIWEKRTRSLKRRLFLPCIK